MSPVARELSTEWSVLEPLQSARSVKGQVEELKRVLELEAAIPVPLIGFSWGAWLAALCAAQYPTMVERLILVSSGPFEAKYATRIHETRMQRLTQKERAEISELNKALQNPAIKEESALFARFGALFSKADCYDPLEHESDVLEYQLDVFQKVWPEAAELRLSGQLLKRVKQISCPVLAIHGDYDPHPIEGVEIPLSRTLQNFHCTRLRHCGHKPWIERQAKDEFYAILKEHLYTGKTL